MVICHSVNRILPRSSSYPKSKVTRCSLKCLLFWFRNFRSTFWFSHKVVATGQTHFLTSKYTQIVGAAERHWQTKLTVLPRPASWTWPPLLGGDEKGTIRKRMGGKRRRASIYPRPRNRTNCYKSFIHHALLKFQ